MERYSLLLLLLALFGVVGWGMALWWWTRAKRYLTAFDRAFAVARRVYNFSETERADYARLIGRVIETDPSAS